MALHSSKTKAMVIGTSSKLRTNTQPLEIKLGAEAISVSDCEKLLGVYIDKHLSWNDHITFLLKKA
jgi:hypothetical protein